LETNKIKNTFVVGKVLGSPYKSPGISIYSVSHRKC